MKKVLVLDDEKDILEVWHWHFKLWGEEVELYTGANGVEGIELMMDHSFDLIITDFKMPEMDGLEFIQQVREGNNHTPIFLFTGYLPELGFLTSQLENVMFFEKPVIGGRLKNAIKICLNTKSVPVEAI